jgi:hypothetical protein
MLEVQRPEDMEQYVGKDLGASSWILIDQERINIFAEVTGDDNWIHVDVERAKRELPGGKTIAHGLLTFSLVPYMGGQICKILERSRGINYGSNKVRFTAPVPCGARIRLHRTLEKYEAIEGGVRLTFGNRMEMEGSEKPVLVAETISVIYGK